jgi:flagellar motor switch protein FliM
MERVLSQDEIDAMIRVAQGQQTASPRNEERSIKPCALRKSGQMGAEQVRAITELHETFTRNLAQSLGAILRVPFEMRLVSVEQLVYQEFLERTPQITYLASLNVSPMNASAVLQVDHSLVFPLIDLMLGGTGYCEAMTREVTEIEEQVMESVARLICKELAMVWGPLGVEVELAKREVCARMQRLLPVAEKTMCLNFEATVGETRGTLNLVCPVAVSNPLLRRIMSEGYAGRSDRRSGSRLREKMLECTFPVKLRLTPIRRPIESLVSLSPGAVYDLGVPVAQVASLVIEGREICQAAPVRHGSRRAAQVSSLLSFSPEATRQ